MAKILPRRLRGTRAILARTPATGCDAPHHGWSARTIGMTEQVANNAQLMRAGANGKALGPFGPGTTGRDELPIGQETGGILVCQADPMARVMVGEARQDMQVVVIQ